MGRGLNVENIKKVIDALRHSPQTYSQLLQLGIPERSLSRILKDYLSYWKIVTQKDGKWFWYDNVKKFSSSDEYNIALAHSKQLLPSISSLLLEDLDPTMEFPIYNKKEKITIGKTLEFKEYVEEHLITGYSDTYNTLIEYRNIKKEYEEELKHYSTTYSIEGLSYFNWESINNNVDQYESNHVKMTNQEQISKIINRIENLYKIIAGDLLLIVKKIEHGTPLKGKCEICPNVIIKS